MGPHRRPRTHLRRNLQDQHRDLNKTLRESSDSDSDDHMSIEEINEDEHIFDLLTSVQPISQDSQHIFDPLRGKLQTPANQAIQLFLRRPALTITQIANIHDQQIVEYVHQGERKQLRLAEILERIATIRRLLYGNTSATGASLTEVITHQETTMSTELPIPVGEIISLIQDFDGNLRELESFIRNTDVVWDLLDENYQATHKLRVTLAIRSRLKGKAAEAIRDLTTNSWPAIKTLLRTNLRSQEGPKLALLQLSKLRENRRAGQLCEEDN